jgi:hypothetical protein
MKAAHEKRLQALEATALPPEPLRILRAFINPDRSMTGFYAEGRHFKRQRRETDEAFEARVLAELGGHAMNCPDRNWT